MDILACEGTLLTFNPAPVREMIRDEENGLLADFFDVDGLTAQALRVLRDPLLSDYLTISPGPFLILVGIS